MAEKEEDKGFVVKDRRRFSEDTSAEESKAGAVDAGGSGGKEEAGEARESGVVNNPTEPRAKGRFRKSQWPHSSSPSVLRRWFILERSPSRKQMRRSPICPSPSRSSTPWACFRRRQRETSTRMKTGFFGRCFMTCGCAMSKNRINKRKP